MAALELTIRSNSIKAKIDKSQENSRCRMCGKAEESVKNVLSKYTKLAQKEHKRRHDKIQQPGAFLYGKQKCQKITAMRLFLAYISLALKRNHVMLY